MVTIAYTQTNELAKITHGSQNAAGYDLYSTEEYTLKPLERKLFKTGLKMAIPVGLYGRIAPRSGLAYKRGIDVMAGVIDSDYRGEIGVILINFGQEEKKFSIGDAIAQIIFEHYTPATFVRKENLDETVRGEGGFGSTERLSKTFQPKGDGTVPSEVPNLQSGVQSHPSLTELYQKAGGVEIKKKYSEEIKERQQAE